MSPFQGHQESSSNSSFQFHGQTSSRDSKQSFCYFELSFFFIWMMFLALTLDRKSSGVDQSFTSPRLLQTPTSEARSSSTTNGSKLSTISERTARNLDLDLILNPSNATEATQKNANMVWKINKFSKIIADKNWTSKMSVLAELFCHQHRVCGWRLRSIWRCCNAFLAR